MESIANATTTRPAEESLSRECVVNILAEELHRKMEHLDATDLPEWAKMTEDQKSFYRTCVRQVLLQEELLLAYLAAGDAQRPPGI